MSPQPLHTRLSADLVVEDVYKRQREYHADGAFDDLAIDIEKAIDYCIDNDILKEFLKTYRSEAVSYTHLVMCHGRHIKAGFVEHRKTMSIIRTAS